MLNVSYQTIRRSISDSLTPVLTIINLYVIIQSIRGYVVDMLRIDDYNNVIIKKITSRTLYFNYLDSEYFLKVTNSDYEASLDLYERIPVSKNRYAVEYLSSCTISTFYSINMLVKQKAGISKSNTCVYSQIDVKAFVLNLMNFGLVCGSDSLELYLRGIKERVRDNNKKISVLEGLILKLRKENDDLQSFQQGGIL